MTGAEAPARQARRFEADRTWVDGVFRDGVAVRVGPDGRILSVGGERPEGDEVVRLAGAALVPACVDAHSHAFQVLLRGRAGGARSFQEWVDGSLYPLVEDLDEDALRASALLAFSEMARSGVAAVGEFHYVHNRKGDHEPQGERYAEVVLQAARAVGLRVALLRTFYDTADRPGRRRFAEGVDRAVAATEALGRRHRGDPHVRVLPAPHSLHGASAVMIRAAAELARGLDCRWHIHLAEQASDVERARALHGATPLAALEALGVLDGRTVLVHGVWLDPMEVALAGRSGAGLVSCPLTNLELGDGVGPVPELVAAGVRVGLGTDANTRPDVYAEMRALELAQRSHRRRMGVLEDRQLLEAGTAGGAALLGFESGRIEAGLLADLVALDLDDPSLWPGAWGDSAGLLHNVVHALRPASAVRALYVGGEPVVEGGRLTRVDLEAVRRGLGG
ncbi:MAG: amidohydrolase family protein [Planctomycetes bacterium]|nr:amidohydrolase family protein [Planctomycetota bacterium]